MDGDKMKFKKVLISLLPICLLLILSACGCKHEWTEATCLNSKTCNLCGVTEGEPIEHSYMDANCTNPKRCSFCDATEGNALGHNFIDGYCTNCYQEDPNYINLQTFGFTNMYGMTEWIKISKYSLSEKYVNAYKYSVYVFYDNYMQHVQIRNTDKIIGENLDVNNLSYINPCGKYPCIYTSNDNLSVNDSFIGDHYIIERVVDKNNKIVVLKALTENSKEVWFVPCDILDFSTAIEIDGKTIRINFK